MNTKIEKLEIVYVVPSRYDDDGYVQRWIKGVVPSNSLSVLKGLTASMADNKPFGDVDVNVTSYDDNVQQVPVEKIASMEQDGRTRVVVGIVGVQSNQFPRAVDIALKFRKHGIAVMIGGFHVTGVMNLFDTIPDSLMSVIDEGVTIVCGESETQGVLENLFSDAIAGTLKPVYRFPMAPDIEHAPLPSVDPSYVDHFGARWATIDSSRGCPYGCSFCTVINIQGRKMRCRSAERVLETVRNNYDKGVANFFFTDDNFARNKNWETILDGMIEMREGGRDFGFMMQIDTQAYKIPNFLEKADRAGCRSVFIGMESVNPANIAAAGKTQNHIDQYRPMVALWQERGIMVHVGYIIGFPNDTMESVRNDVRFLRDNVNVDLVSFFMLTPLPGSVDHKNMIEQNVWLDPDFNKYDSFHETYIHPNMKPGEWMTAARAAYAEFYTKENIVKILRRTRREHYWLTFWNLIWYRYSGVFSGTHPMMTGFFRQKDRLDRRPCFATEGFFQFQWRWLKDFVFDSMSYIKLFFEFQEIWFLTRNPHVEKVTEVVVEMPADAPLEPNSTVYGNLKVSRRRLAGLYIWKPLANLKLRWAAIKRTISEYSWSGNCEQAVAEIRSALCLTASRLREQANKVMRSMGHSGKREAAKLNAVAMEIDNYLKTIDNNPPDQTLLERSQRFVSERLIERYEALACRYVTMRRKVNNLRRDVFERMNRGKVVSSLFLLGRKPWLLASEMYLSYRFMIAMMRKEL
ncbi:MAG: radical SAM protein [Planctomycetaceae bacterium]|jgi:radical SAM superfamily enzyme YgiQ (UPF0313 family)|nr:radical SAM protein [Planctomycetaceae bacterium]